jgi:general secretion pathway protein G
MRNSGSMRRRGFTLIEVLLVLVILMILGGVAVVVYPRIQAGAEKNAAKVMVDNTAQGVELYRTAVGKYPTTEEGLNALINAPEDAKLAEKWRNGGGPWLKDGVIPNDPWNNPLKYELLQTSEGSSGTPAPSGPAFRVWSTGPDGTDGTEDDISSSPKEASTK